MSSAKEFRLHPSSFEDWQGCGHRFELSSIKLERPRYVYPAALNGTAIHRVIDMVHKEHLWDMDNNKLADIYLDCFHWAIANPVREEEIGVPVWWGEYQNADMAFPKLAVDGLQMIKGYMADQRNREAQLLVSEGKWRADFGGFGWEGTLDQARLLPGNEVALVDLKSGAEARSGPSLLLWPQGFTYALALRHATFRRTGTNEWLPLELKADRLIWVKLRDYIPYLKSGTKKGGSYQKGDLRGPAYYEVKVTPAALASHEREMKFFAEAVKAGRFERRPSPYQCSRCDFTEQCLLGFYGSIAPEELAKAKAEVDYE